MPEEKSLAIYCSILLLGNKLNYSVETKSCLAGLKYSIKKTKQKKMRRRGRGIERISRRWWFGEQFKLVCGTQLLGYWILTRGELPPRRNEIAIIVRLPKSQPHHDFQFKPDKISCVSYQKNEEKHFNSFTAFHCFPQHSC